MQKFSFYQGGIKKITPTAAYTIEEAVEIIKDEKDKESVILLRKVENQRSKDDVKSKLSYFTFSGTFKKRNNQSLIEHSGLICIDLDPYQKNKSGNPKLVNPRLVDEFESVRAELIADRFTTCLFTSPSGTGFKVIFRIDGKCHLQSFHAIEAYYLEKFKLILDKGVNDVSRACYLSYDPEIYYNNEADFFTIGDMDDALPSSENEPSGEDNDQGPLGNNDKAPLSASEQFKRNKNLERANYVVEQAEKDNIDLTGDYSDWQLIAFSLATFGEDGRSLFHRVSKQYSEYDQKEADAKFDNALAKGRFTSPAKFFTTAKDYGLETKMPRTISEVKEELTYENILGDKEHANDMATFGFYQKGGCYYSTDLKGKIQQISNFKMRIIYHVETSDVEAYRLIQIKNIFGYDVVIQMNTDDFVSVGSFKKIIARKGNFIFKGTDADLSRLSDKLQRDEMKTELIKQLGYNKRYNFYAWANGIYDCHLNEFVPADELGIVKHYELNGDEMVPINFFIPAMSKMYIHKDDLYVNHKKFLLVENDHSFKEFAGLFCKVFGSNGKIAITFYLMCLFSDIVFRVMGDRFPMLNVYGQKGTGKGTMIEILMKLFGKGQKQLMLGGASTVVGFMRKSGQFSNAAVWLDEYKNTLKTNFIESLKNLYDRIGYERGKKDNSLETESTTIDSGVIVSGQDMPTIEEALFSRFIQVIMVKPNKTDESTRLFEALKDMQSDGLSNITVDLLKHRTMVNDRYKKAFKDEQYNLVKAVNNAEVDDRFFNNYASMIAMASLISEVETLPFNMNEFREICKKTLIEQFYVLKGSDSIGKFWNIIEVLFNSNVIHENREFIIKEGKLHISINNTYQHYAEAMQKRKDPGTLDEATLKNYLENDPKNFIERKKVFWGTKQHWCYIFDYPGLGIDLISADNEIGLKHKYESMGVEYKSTSMVENAESYIKIPVAGKVNTVQDDKRLF